MIIQYDTRPNATIDEKLRSLIESIQLAFGEVGIDASNMSTSQSQDTDSLLSAIRKLSDEIESLTEIVIAVDTRNPIAPEESGTYILTVTTDAEAEEDEDKAVYTWEIIPTVPAEDGVYVLTATVTDGTPEYTWEVQEV